MDHRRKNNDSTRLRDILSMKEIFTYEATVTGIECSSNGYTVKVGGIITRPPIEPGTILIKAINGKRKNRDT